jgi:hypothetical protein
MKWKRFLIVSLLFPPYDLFISYLRNSQMKNYRLLTIIGTVITSLFSSWLPVAAQTYNGASIYRDADSIYKVGITPNSSVAVTYADTTLNKTVYSDACGVLKISFGANPPANLSINNADFNVSTVPEMYDDSKYKCVGGVPTYTKFKTHSGLFRIIKYSDGTPTSTTLYISSAGITKGANKASLISYAGSSKRTVKANACGFVAIKPLARNPFSGNIVIDGTVVSFATLPQNPTPPSCMGGKTYLSSTGAITYNGANLYRTDKAIYYVGLTPNSLNQVELTGLASKSFNYYKGDPQMYGYVPLPACGVFRIMLGKGNYVSSLKIGSNNYNVATTSQASARGCTPDDLAGIVPNTLYRGSGLMNGTASEFVYRVSDVTQKKLTVEYPTIVSRNLPVNACGFAEIKSLNLVGGFNATDKVKINGTEYVVASLPLAPMAPICRNGVIYQTN